MITLEDLRKLETLSARLKDLKDAEDGYNIGDDVAWLVDRIKQLDADARGMHQQNLLMRGLLKAIL